MRSSTRSPILWSKLSFQEFLAGGSFQSDCKVNKIYAPTRSDVIKLLIREEMTQPCLSPSLLESICLIKQAAELPAPAQAVSAPCGRGPQQKTPNDYCRRGSPRLNALLGALSWLGCPCRMMGGIFSPSESTEISSSSNLMSHYRAYGHQLSQIRPGHP